MDTGLFFLDFKFPEGTVGSLLKLSIQKDCVNLILLKRPSRNWFNRSGKLKISGETPIG